jgi:hypothetical protein
LPYRKALCPIFSKEGFNIFLSFQPDRGLIKH